MHATLLRFICVTFGGTCQTSQMTIQEIHVRHERVGNNSYRWGKNAGEGNIWWILNKRIEDTNLEIVVKDEGVTGVGGGAWTVLCRFKQWRVGAKGEVGDGAGVEASEYSSEFVLLVLSSLIVQMESEACAFASANRLASRELGPGSPSWIREPYGNERVLLISSIISCLICRIWVA